jgi:hypothetical protein
MQPRKAQRPQKTPLLDPQIRGPEPVGRDWLLAPLDGPWAQVLRFEPATQSFQGRLAEDNLSWARPLLETLAQVHDIADHRVLEPIVAAQQGARPEDFAGGLLQQLAAQHTSDEVHPAAV